MGLLEDLLGGNVVEAYRVTQDQMNGILNRARQKGITQEQEGELVDAYNIGADSGHLLDMVDGFVRENASNAAASKAEQIDAQAVLDALGMTDQSLSEVGSRISDVNAEARNYGNMLQVPGMVRTSSEFGNALSGAESYINAAAENARRTAAASTAGSGLRASGGAADVARTAELNAASQKAANFGNVMNQVAARKTATEQYGDTLRQTQDALRSQKAQLQLGKMPTYLGLQQFKLGAMPNFNQQETITGPKLGIEEARTGYSQNLMSAILALIQNGTDSAMDMGTSALGMIRQG